MTLAAEFGSTIAMEVELASSDALAVLNGGTGFPFLLCESKRCARVGKEPSRALPYSVLGFSFSLRRYECDYFLLEGG